MNETEHYKALCECLYGTKLLWCLAKIHPITLFIIQ